MRARAIYFSFLPDRRFAFRSLRSREPDGLPTGSG